MAKENAKHATSTTDEIKRKHNVQTVYTLEIEGEDGLLTAYLRKPNFDELGAYMSLAQNNILKASKVLLNSIFLEGDRAILDEEDNFLGAMSAIDEIVKVRQAKVKKS